MQRTAAPRFWRSYRPGLGDAMVVFAFTLLAWVSLAPHVTGRRLARRERDARTTLLRLRELAVGSGLTAALADCHVRLAAAEPALRLYEEHLSERQAIDFWPLLHDDAYFYRLDLATRGALAQALPKRTGVTGRLVFRVEPNGEVAESLLALPSGQSLPPDAQPNRGENLARVRVATLARCASQAGLPTAISRFAEEAETLLGSPPDVAAPSTALFPLGAAAFPVWRLPCRYWVRCCLVPDNQVPRVVLFAWPDTIGHSGFAAFRSGPRGLQQSRNMVRPYFGRASEPIPGAGLMRPGSRPDLQGGYTGYDGNRWFPVAVDT